MSKINVVCYVHHSKIKHHPLVDPATLSLSLSLSLFSSGLAKVIHVAATFGMVVGSELHERAVLPKDHYIIQAFINSAVRYYLAMRIAYTGSYLESGGQGFPAPVVDSPL